MAAGREEDAGAVLDEGDGEDEPGVLRDDVGDLVMWGGRPRPPLLFLTSRGHTSEWCEFVLDAQRRGSRVEDEVVARRAGFLRNLMS